MNIILSSDIELWSWNRRFNQDVEKGVLELVKLAEKEKIPITLFLSLSDKGYGEEKYLQKIEEVIKKINSKYISFGIHTHCKNLPLEFPTPSDNLKDYSKEEIVKILRWYKKNLEKFTKKKIISHRAGGYNIPNLKILEECFKKTGIKIDSSDISRNYGEKIKTPFIIEIPPATNRKLSKKLRVWGPEQMSNKEIIDFYKQAKDKTETLVIVFHSFSVFGSLGKKARIWHKMPNVARKMMKPLIKKIKKQNIQQKNKEVSENFKRLIKMIKWLKETNNKFIRIEEMK